MNTNLDLETLHVSIKTELGISSRGDIGLGDIKMKGVYGNINVLK